MNENINFTNLPNFHGSSEDPDAFLFEFEVICRSFSYTTDAQKLRPFPSTLKDIAVRWFTSLEETPFLHGIK